SSKVTPHDDCVICLSNITERAQTRPCNHTAFDFICLVSWLQERSNCPLCKAEVTTVEYDRKSDKDFKIFHVKRTHSSKPAPPAAASSRSNNTSRPPPPRRPRPPRPYTRPSPSLALLRRRHVYRENLYSAYVGANRISAHSNWTPESFSSSPDLQSRARMFIRRELRVFSFLYNDADGSTANAPTTSSNAEWLLSYIVSILKTVDIKASDGHAEDLLSEFIGRESARLFLHELNAWLRSPYTKLEDWDSHVQYQERLPDYFDADG
ncbi:hypothetical protein BU24DRAFT_322426, partial [Aaosphaeria arxii CBS 175.79]